MIEFLASVTGSGQDKESAFMRMGVLDSTLPVVPEEEQKDGDHIKYDSGYFLQHNIFTVSLKLQDVPKDSPDRPVIGKVYKVTIEEVEHEGQRVKKDS